MEGPSLVIACEEFAQFVGKKPDKATGIAPLDFSKLQGKRFLGAMSWGKHFLLRFPGATLRVHFLMFGSYRINHPRENRIPKLTLRFGTDEVSFYSCAIKEIEGRPENLYDWTIDVMSKQWSPAKAVRQVQARPSAQVCDVLMDQEVFAGLGNIIKNEVLFRLKLHPETLVADLTPSLAKALVAEARAYSLQFYRWKKKNELKRHWRIFRKRDCPDCQSRVVKRPTGRGQRMSHYCPSCQALALDSSIRMPRAA